MDWLNEKGVREKELKQALKVWLEEHGSKMRKRGGTDVSTSAFFGMSPPYSSFQRLPISPHHNTMNFQNVLYSVNIIIKLYNLIVNHFVFRSYYYVVSLLNSLRVHA